MSTVNPLLEPGWKEVLKDEFHSPYFMELKAFLLKEKEQGQIIYPPGKFIFNAFNHTPFDKVKVVILGQDPYHGEGQAHGLSFSVPDGIKPPPSLANIFKELKNDLNLDIPTTGNLTAWARQGVLLLNTTLTVRSAQPASHFDKGWEQFTDAVIRKLSQNRKKIVFLLWGKNAHAKESLIDTNSHYILKAPHPSPFSAHTGFFGCHHFSITNKLLIENAQEPINWSLL